jgi:putative sterol carrier protein
VCHFAHEARLPRCEQKGWGLGNGKPSNQLGVQRSLAYRYMTQDWAEEALRRIESDERIKKVLNGVDLSILSIIADGPKGAYGFLYVHYDGQGLAEYRVGHEYSAVAGGILEPTFVISGKYEVFLEIQLGKLGEKKAIITGKLHLTGSMMKALRHMRAMETITKVLREIPIMAE